MTMCAPLGLTIDVRPRLLHYQDYHAVTIRTLQRRTHSVMALAQERGQPLLLPVLIEFQRDYHLQGGDM